MHYARGSQQDHLCHWMGFFSIYCHAIRVENSPKIFSRVVVVIFKKFMHKFLEVYFDHWTVFGLVKKHVLNLRMMLDIFQRHHISLNLKKFIFYVPFWILLEHILCKQGLMVDPSNIVVIINLEVPTTKKQLCFIVGNKCYYKNFIQGYALITTPIEK